MQAEWPTSLLVVVLCLAAAGVVLPWIIPLKRRGLATGFLAAIAATASWLSYEIQLRLVMPPGDPLIRLDLCLILPLIALDWISALAAVVRAKLVRWTDAKRASESSSV